MEGFPPDDSSKCRFCFMVENGAEMFFADSAPYSCRDCIEMCNQLLAEFEKDSLTWIPQDCENRKCGFCNEVFDPEIWESDWSLSGELAWMCPKCGHLARDWISHQ
jgi:hypothetical protein